jgi:hypothetical protein
VRHCANRDIRTRRRGVSQVAAGSGPAVTAWQEFRLVSTMLAAFAAAWLLSPTTVVPGFPSSRPSSTTPRKSNQLLPILGRCRRSRRLRALLWCRPWVSIGHCDDIVLGIGGADTPAASRRGPAARVSRGTEPGHRNALSRSQTLFRSCSSRPTLGIGRAARLEVLPDASQAPAVAPLDAVSRSVREFLRGTHD